jgi:RNA ligase
VFYDFPVIKSLDDVLPAIKDADEFIVADREDHFIVNYVVNFPTSFPPVETVNDAIRRECRGMVFDHNGDLISRRLHKFFNINERPETQANLIDLGQPHVIMDKMDGSMITPIPLQKGMRFGTKMGITEVGMNAETFAFMQEGYQNFANWCEYNRLTPIFEWTSRKNRIVIDYSVDNLVLTAIRENYTGEYIANFQEIGTSWNIPVVQTYNQIEEITQFIETVRGMAGIEGYVLRFNNGHMLKFKTEEYCLLHNSREVAATEHQIIQAIVENRIDDLKSLLIKEDLDKVNELEKEFWVSIGHQEWKYNAIFNHAYHLSSGDKKKFALEIAPQYDRDDVSILYQLFDGRELRQVLLNRVGKNATQKLKYENFKLRHMIFS